ncbi:hypothetical protein VM1G_00409 [Cytospora mali]|uniref:Ricin B lectin domain-containing protein n=1 Tax=Cytospora mali TaxID=578113 RepID=A0A194VMG6_CYTMA|nr:hypothetical protein VM1G_00409 [Valsa mali]
MLPNILTYANIHVAPFETIDLRSINIMAFIKSISLLILVAATSADPVIWPRTVPSLDEAATAQAQQRDDTATRALSNTQIKNFDGKCLFVDKLSGDSRANLTPVQVADCGSADGQGWDIIIDGKHINAAESMLIVSTLTNACFDFDPRGPVGSQVSLYSCGGSPDGSGSVSASQVFPFDGRPGPLSLRPGNGPGKCLAVNGLVVDVASCNDGDETQKFTFVGDGTAATTAVSTTTEQAIGNPTTAGSATATAAATLSTGTSTGTSTTETSTTGTSTTVASSTVTSTTGTSTTGTPATGTPTTGTPTTGTSTTGTSTTEPLPTVTSVTSKSTISELPSTESIIATKTPTTPTRTTTDPVPSGKSTIKPVRVSQVGGFLDPTAAAEAHAHDDTAVRAFSSVFIRTSNGRCLSVDHTAGDYRQNLIPVSLIDCEHAVSTSAL